MFSIVDVCMLPKFPKGLSSLVITVLNYTILYIFEVELFPIQIGPSQKYEGKGIFSMNGGNSTQYNAIYQKCQYISTQ